MGFNCSDKLLRDLEVDNNDAFSDMVETFSRYAYKARLPVVCFYETKKTNPAKAVLPKFVANYASRWTATVVSLLCILPHASDTIYQLVPGDSAKLAWADSEKLPVAHVMLTKYRGKDDENFRAVYKKLQTFAEHAKETLAARDPLGVAGTLKETEWLKPEAEIVRTQTRIHSEALQDRLEESGQWFLDGQIYKDWVRNSPKFLWLHGEGTHQNGG